MPDTRRKSKFCRVALYRRLREKLKAIGDEMLDSVDLFFCECTDYECCKICSK